MSIRLFIELRKVKTGQYPVCVAKPVMSAESVELFSNWRQSMTSVFRIESRMTASNMLVLPLPCGPWTKAMVAIGEVSAIIYYKVEGAHWVCQKDKNTMPLELICALSILQESQSHLVDGF